MEALLAWYNTASIHPIEKSAIFHILFERIHPFSDGTGRAGRLILNLELIKAGYQIVDIKFRDRAKYIQALQAYDTDNNATPFINMVANYQLETLQDLRDSLHAKKNYIPADKM